MEVQEGLRYHEATRNIRVLFRTHDASNAAGRGRVLRSHELPYHLHLAARYAYFVKFDHRSEPPGILGIMEVYGYYPAHMLRNLCKKEIWR